MPIWKRGSIPRSARPGPSPPTVDREYLFAHLVRNIESACIKARRYNLARGSQVVEVAHLRLHQRAILSAHLPPVAVEGENVEGARPAGARRLKERAALEGSDGLKGPPIPEAPELDLLLAPYGHLPDALATVAPDAPATTSVSLRGLIGTSPRNPVHPDWSYRY